MWVGAGGGISVSSTLKPVVLIGKVTCEQGPAGDVGGSHHRLLGKGQSMCKGLSWSMSKVFEGQQEGQCGWRRVGKRKSRVT